MKLNNISEVIKLFRIIDKNTNNLDFERAVFEGPIKTYIKFSLSPEEIEYTEEEREFRITCLNEELNEFILACDNNDHDEKVDALVDLLIFSVGTSYRMNNIIDTLERYKTINVNSISDHFSKLYIKKLEYINNKENYNDLVIKDTLSFLIEQFDSKTRNDIYILNQIVAYCIHALKQYEPIEILKSYYNMVVEANMNKTVGPLSKRGSFSIDLVKPEGWQAPSLTKIKRKLKY